MLDHHVYDLIPGYALGSLDEADLLRVARHLPECASCRKEFDAFAETADALAYAVPMVDPPSSLRQRVIHRAGTEMRDQAFLQPVIPEKTGEEYTRPVKRTKRFRFLREFFAAPSRAVWMAVGLALLVLGIYSVLITRQNNLLRETAMASTAEQSDIRLVRLIGTEIAPDTVGYLMVFRGDRYGTLAVENAAVLEPAKQYQIWLIEDGQRTNGGVFSVNENGYGVLEINAAQPLEDYQSFGITIEPAGGSSQPTGPKVLGGDF